MQAQFVSLAVGYALAGGKLRRKGVKQRPWLELRRLETETVYLGHQVKALRQAGRSGFVADVDTIGGEGFYDVRRARLHSPLLERVMELLQADGHFRVTAEALQVAGLRGMASLWLDVGRWSQHSGFLDLPEREDGLAVRDYLASRGITASPITRCGATLRLKPVAMEQFAALVRPYVHRSMRHALHPGSRHGTQLLNSRALQPS